MKYDKRRALPQGFALTIQDPNTGNSLTAAITKEIGRGGSCIVYAALRKNVRAGETPVGDLPVIIKEFYPKSLDAALTRGADMALVPENADTASDFARRLSVFTEGQACHILFASRFPDHALPAAIFTGNALGTFYAVSTPGQGTTLADLDRNTLTLTDALTLTASLCEAISLVHTGGRENGLRTTRNLFLDCKPDNVYVSGGRACLFDFDTVQPYGRLRYCSCSKGWSAPEQVDMDENGYADPRKIGFHTDIYGIGAVLIYLLTGKDPDEAGAAASEYSANWLRGITLRDENEALADPTFSSELDRVVRAVLEPDPDRRKADYGSSDAAVRLRSELEHLAALAENVPYRRGFEETEAAISEAREESKDAIAAAKAETRDAIASANTKTKEAIAAAKAETSQAVKASEARTKEAISAAKAETGEAISEARSDIQKSIEKHSVKNFLFGSRKRTAITLCVFCLLAAVFGAVAALSHRTVTRISSGIEQDTDLHLLLKLDNANHQYEMGLENWRRLDYNRAERDILAARDEISEEISQSELEVAKVNNSLGCLYLDMGRYADAYDYLNAAFVTFCDTLGEKSLEARAVRTSIAAYDYYVGKPDAALIELQYVLDSSDQMTEKPVLAGVNRLRALISDAQGRYDEALAIYDEVLALCTDIATSGKMTADLADYASDPALSRSDKDDYNHAIRWIVQTYGQIARVNIHKKAYMDAIQAAQTGLDLAMGNDYISKRNLLTARLYMSLAEAEDGLGLTDDGLAHIDLAGRIEMNLFDFTDAYPGLVEVYGIYGSLLEHAGKTEEADEYFVKATDLARGSYGDNHPATASALYLLGKSCLRRHKAAEARDCLAEAVEIRRNILAEDHPDTARMYSALAQAQKECLETEESAESLAEARRICDEWGLEGDLRDEILEG